MIVGKTLHWPLCSQQCSLASLESFKHVASHDRLVTNATLPSEDPAIPEVRVESALAHRQSKLLLCSPWG